MFSSVSCDSIQRLLEAKGLIDLCSDKRFALADVNRNVIMGNVYVMLYGAIEYTITHCVSRTIEILNKETLSLYEVIPTLWGLIYNPDCTRMESGGSNKKWENRYKLFKNLTKSEVVSQIEDALFPSSNGNIKETQLQRVWNTFGIKSPLFESDHDMAYKLKTLADYRMAIAHGREKASTIGGYNSVEDLIDFYNSISRYCSYLITCFEQYINNKEYLQSEGV